MSRFFLGRHCDLMNAAKNRMSGSLGSALASPLTRDRTLNKQLHLLHHFVNSLDVSYLD